MSDNHNITLDLNKISRRQFREFVNSIQDAESGEERDRLTGELLAKVVVTWPYDVPPAEYYDLGVLDAQHVDDVLTDAFNIGNGQKKLEPSST